tara:strand:+ start:2251 stop:3606 length:1356 start_codon:yes stop_codon:yes gene_type:complete
MAEPKGPFQFFSKLDGGITDGPASKLDPNRAKDAIAGGSGEASQKIRQGNAEQGRLKRLANRQYRAASRGDHKDAAGFMQAYDNLKKIHGNGETSGAGIGTAGDSTRREVDKEIGRATTGASSLDQGMARRSLGMDSVETKGLDAQRNKGLGDTQGFKDTGGMGESLDPVGNPTTGFEENNVGGIPVAEEEAEPDFEQAARDAAYQKEGNDRFDALVEEGKLGADKESVSPEFGESDARIESAIDNLDPDKFTPEMIDMLRKDRAGLSDQQRKDSAKVGEAAGEEFEKKARSAIEGGRDAIYEFESNQDYYASAFEASTKQNKLDAAKRQSDLKEKWEKRDAEVALERDALLAEQAGRQKLRDEAKPKTRIDPITKMNVLDTPSTPMRLGYEVTFEQEAEARSRVIEAAGKARRTAAEARARKSRAAQSPGIFAEDSIAGGAWKWLKSENL